MAISRLIAHQTSLRSSTMTHIQDGAGIAMILSPAKTLDLTPLSDREFAVDGVNADVIEKLSNKYASPLCDGNKTDVVVNAMKEKSESELKSLLKLSPALAKSSHEVRDTSLNYFRMHSISNTELIHTTNQSTGRLLK